MATNYNPRIVTDGLVLALDAGNPKGYDKYENLVIKSEDLTIAAGFWSEVGDGVTVTTNQAIAPDGTLTADKVAIKNTNSGGKAIQGSVLSPSVTGQAYTASIFCKAAEHSYVRVDMEGAGNTGGIVVDLSNGSLISQVSAPDSYSIQSYSNGWYRIAATSTAVSTAGSALRVYLTDASGNSLFSGTTGNGVYMWGGQFEAASGVTDYYPTTGTAKTRGTTWTDLSGQGNNGTLTNGPTYSSSNGGSIVFDGVDDYVNIPNFSSLALSPACTISIWSYIKQNIGYHFWGNLIFLVEIQTNQTYRLRFNLDGDWRSTYTTSFPLNTWHKLDITWDGTNTKMYINSQETVNSTLDSVYTAFSNTTNQPLEISRRVGFSNSNSNISQVSIYNRALTASEIQQNFNALRGRFSI